MTAVAHDVTLSMRNAIIAIVAVFVALALAISLPLAFRGTITVTKYLLPAVTHQNVQQLTGVALLRASHGG